MKHAAPFVFGLVVFALFVITPITACAIMLNTGYYQIDFFGTTNSFDGSAQLPIVGTSSTYTPFVGDSFVLNFGAFFWHSDDDLWGGDAGFWGSDLLADGWFQNFQISTGDENYSLSASSATDWFGGTSSSPDDFSVNFIFKIGDNYFGLGYIDFDFNNGTGSVQLYHPDFNWQIELKSAELLATPVPEPSTIMLTCIGLMFLAKRGGRGPL